MEIVVVDIGGTHARFALAELTEGRIVLGPETVLRTGDYDGLADAWKAFGRNAGRALPRDVGIAIAAPIEGDVVRMTNNRWVLQRGALAGELGVARISLINDFEAVGHAVAACGVDLHHVCGPEMPLPNTGVVTIVGPGTGLGVAILRRSPERNDVIATEGGHIGFAPANPLEDLILARLRDRYGRVSVERVACGPGLAEIHAVMTGANESADDRMLWQLALGGTDQVAAAAMERFCEILGAAAGDLALAHGAQAVVIAGGLGLRLADQLPRSGFARRFTDKGRYAGRMAALPVKLITHPQPGLLGAAAAFAARHGA